MDSNKLMVAFSPQHIINEDIYEAIGYCYEKLKQPALARLQYRKASHLRKDDSRLFYKIACTYYTEGQWNAAYKQVEVALRMFRNDYDFQLLAGQCCEQLSRMQEAAVELGGSLSIAARPGKGTLLTLTTITEK